MSTPSPGSTSKKRPIVPSVRYQAGGARFPGSALLTPRRLLGLGAGLCALLVGIALYFQHVMHLEPCPLCIVQRVLVTVLALVMAVAAVHDPKGRGRRVYGGLVAVVALAGTAVAGRHVYLQNLPPDRIPECGPGLQYILDAFPPGEALALILRGSGECAEVQWTLLGLSIPGWTLTAFVGFTLMGVFLCAARGSPAALEADLSSAPTNNQ